MVSIHHTYNKNLCSSPLSVDMISLRPQTAPFLHTPTSRILSTIQISTSYTFHSNLSDWRPASHEIVWVNCQRNYHSVEELETCAYGLLSPSVPQSQQFQRRVSQITTGPNLALKAVAGKISTSVANVELPLLKDILSASSRYLPRTLEAPVNSNTADHATCTARSLERVVL
jgi:hypothetical protein